MTKHKKEASDEEVHAVPDETPRAQQSAPTQTVQAETHAVGDPLKDAVNHVAKGGKAEAMRAKLQAEPKVRILVPLAAGEKEGVTQSVILNGYSFYIRKGEYLDVPQSVAEVLEAKMKNKSLANRHPLRVNGNSGVKMDEFGS